MSSCTSSSQKKINFPYLIKLTDIFSAKVDLKNLKGEEKKVRRRYNRVISSWRSVVHIVR
jgi:hypothetical protein